MVSQISQSVALVTGLVLEVPMVPDMALGGNSRLHWTKRHRLFQAEKVACYELVYIACNYDPGIPHFQHLNLGVEVVFQDKRNRDQDNVMHALKALFDALVQLGVMPDDDTAHQTTTLTITVDRERAPLTILRMEEA